MLHSADLSLGRIARLSAPCPSHKKTLTQKLKSFANTNARGSAIAIPELRSGELKSELKIMSE